MMKNKYLHANIGADTAEIERTFAENWQLPYGSTMRCLRIAGSAALGHALSHEGMPEPIAIIRAESCALCPATARAAPR